MESSVECTHCRVVMTSWAAPGSPIRYFQCPFCQRTHSSLYGEVFRRRAGARLVDAPLRGAPPSAIPMASPDDVRWARVKASAARWFARLEEDERRYADPSARRLTKVRAAGEAPEVDPEDVVEVVPASARGGRRH